MTAAVPYFGYSDPAAAIEFLVEAFGFEVSIKAEDDDGVIQHGELTRGDVTIMIGVGEAPPRDASVAEQSPRGHGVYVVVEDVDAVHERARDAGATIVYPPQDTEFGTRRVRALDTEGYEWSFGTYDPTEPKEW